MWGKQYLATLLVKWFGPAAVKEIARGERLETLGLLFRDGFGAFDALVARAGLKNRIAGFLVKAFVKRRAMRGIVEMFFAKIYFPFAEKRKAARRG